MDHIEFKTSVMDLDVNVRCYVHGEFIPQTEWEPAQYPEFFLDEVTLSSDDTTELEVDKYFLQDGVDRHNKPIIRSLEEVLTDEAWEHYRS